MRTLILMAALTVYGGLMFGCQDDNPNAAKHEQVEDHTVTDPNGNVISHTEDKSSSSSDSNHPANP